jgi:hypothetical protein
MHVRERIPVTPNCAMYQAYLRQNCSSLLQGDFVCPAVFFVLTWNSKRTYLIQFLRAETSQMLSSVDAVREMFRDLGSHGKVNTLFQYCGSGSALIWLSWTRIQEHGNWPKLTKTLNLVSCLSKRLLYLRSRRHVFGPITYPSLCNFFTYKFNFLWL